MPVDIHLRILPSLAPDGYWNRMKDRWISAEDASVAVMNAHAEATAAGEPGYTDPITGLFVFTSAYLMERGTCCASGCRHCPYPDR